VATSGYRSIGKSTCQIPKSAAARVSLADTIWFFHWTDSSRKCAYSASLFPSGANRTPRVRRASCVGNRGMDTLDPSLLEILRGLEFSSHWVYCQWPFSQVKSIRYQKHLEGTKSPPEAWRSPCQSRSEFCIFRSTARISLD